MLDRFAVVMAGGSGTRLWPLSREAMPKQFIEVDENKSMLAGTIERLCGVVAPEKCFVVTNKKLAEITRETTRNLIPPENIIEEPTKKKHRRMRSVCHNVSAKKIWPWLTVLRARRRICKRQNCVRIRAGARPGGM